VKVLLTISVLFGMLTNRDVPASNNECQRTANMEIYSTTFVSKETGDLDGYELAIEKHNDSTVQALLYVYEGAANDEAISIPGHISDKELTLKGDWAEHQVEYPAKKEIVVIHHVKIRGTVDSKWFRGTLTISGLETPDSVRLKRVHRIWVCKPSNQS
jgi:hypothetical protein